MQYLISAVGWIEVWDATAAGVIRYADAAAAAGFHDVIDVPTFTSDGANTAIPVPVGDDSLTLLPAPPDDFEDIPTAFLRMLERRCTQLHR